jgi:hypothetical protein
MKIPRKLLVICFMLFVAFIVLKVHKAHAQSTARTVYKHPEVTYIADVFILLNRQNQNVGQFYHLADCNRVKSQFFSLRDDNDRGRCIAATVVIGGGPAK